MLFLSVMYVIVEAAYSYQSCVIFGSTHNICIAVDDSVHHFFFVSSRLLMAYIVPSKF
jgi:hypothetical protein